MDVLPTFLELAGIEHSQSFKGREVLPHRGESMLPALSGSSKTVHSSDYVMGWELYGRRAIRQGDWKIVWEPTGIPWQPNDPNIRQDSWRLYNIADDPGEQRDLATRRPNRLKSLIAHWGTYTRETGVVLPGYSAGRAH